MAPGVSRSTVIEIVKEMMDGILGGAGGSYGPLWNATLQDGLVQSASNYQGAAAHQTLRWNGTTWVYTSQILTSTTSVNIADSIVTADNATRRLHFVPNLSALDYNFALAGRQTVSGLTVAVPYFTPNGTSTDCKIALDIFPKGSPTDHTSAGVAWLDVGDSDIVADGTNFEVMRVGKFKNGVGHCSTMGNGTGTIRDLVLQYNGANVRTGLNGTILQATNNATIPAGPTGTRLQIIGANSEVPYVVADGAAIQPIFLGRRCNTSMGSPSNVTTDNILTAYSGGGYGATGYFNNLAFMAIVAAEPWTDTVQGTYLRFSTSTIGAASVAERMRINSTGVGISDTATKCNLSVNGGVQLGAVVSKSTTYTATVNDCLILVSASGGWTLTLPSAANRGQIITVKKTDNNANVITIGRAGSDTIEGATTVTGLNAQYKSYTLQADGTATWYILSAR